MNFLIRTASGRVVCPCGDLSRVQIEFELAHLTRGYTLDVELPNGLARVDDVDRDGVNVIPLWDRTPGHVHVHDNVNSAAPDRTPGHDNVNSAAHDNAHAVPPRDRTPGHDSAVVAAQWQGTMHQGRDTFATRDDAESDAQRARALYPDTVGVLGHGRSPSPARIHIPVRFH